LLILNNWIWSIDIGGLHNWNNLLSVNWHFNSNSSDCLTDNRLVNFDNIGDGWAHYLFNYHLLLDVVWNVLLHVHWHLNWNLHWDMHWDSHLFANWDSLGNFHDVGNLTVSSDWNLFDNAFLGAGTGDITFADSCCGMGALTIALA
jgi:hypothetical protein